MRPSQAVALVATALLAVVVIRDAIVRSSLPLNPNAAKRAWGSHPSVVIADGMAAIGEAVRLHRLVSDRITTPVINASRQSPLSIEPFLVAGIKAQTVNNEFRAGQLFHAAEQRDPRAVAPHLFLSAHYLKIGQDGLSLTELGKLIRLMHGSVGQLAPKIAFAIQNYRGLGVLHALVAENPGLGDDVVRALSTDARNLDLVLSLRRPTMSGDWQPIMVQSLVGAGNYDQAISLWASANSLKFPATSRPLLFDPAFRLRLPPPFGWTLPRDASGAGLVEPAEEGGLHLLYYERGSFSVASQTLLLSPGTYILSQKVRVSSGSPSALSWQIACIGRDKELGRAEFGSTVVRSQIQVPRGCPAQLIDLKASPEDVAETLDATLGTVQLRRQQ